MAAGAQTEAYSPNTGGDSTPARPGGSTAGRGEGGEGGRCAASYRSVGSWCEDAVFSVQDSLALDPITQQIKAASISICQAQV